MSTTRYTVVTRSLLAASANHVEVEGSYAKKGEALAAAEAALGRFGLTNVRVAREVYTRCEATFIVTGREVFAWEEVAEVKHRARPATREEVAAVMAAAREVR